ncbi:MAG TPA: tRNA (guanosine(46)-N7)-methyltransferase TrmB [Stellaceae bacterium]|jgi:tRNA (guanine-N7-)-methyltransferase|nr:tRNA (guanosine(46)-N7)-methyltransferase TrmB [Stellaceae bacterium]
MREEPDQKPGHRRILYGRRRGRPLHRGQQRLIDTLLPRLAVTLPENGTLDPAALFDPTAFLDKGPREIWLEIGFGGGEHLAAQAAAHRDIGMIGCEVFENGIAKLLGEIERQELANIRILTDDARLLLAALPEASISRVFILFPDPWPKQRHHKRRIVTGQTLDTLAALMKDGAQLRLATDDVDYLGWMLARVPLHPAFAWLAEGPADWRSRPQDWPATRYEAKAIAAGRRPYFLRLRRRPR